MKEKKELKLEIDQQQAIGMGIEEGKATSRFARWFEMKLIEYAEKMEPAVAAVADRKETRR